MKFKSHAASWATVLCAAAVFSLFTSRDAQAGGIRQDPMPPPPVEDVTAPTRIVTPLAPPPIDDNLGGAVVSNGDYSGSVMLDEIACGSPHALWGLPLAERTLVTLNVNQTLLV